MDDTSKLSLAERLDRLQEQAIQLQRELNENENEDIRGALRAFVHGGSYNALLSALLRSGD